MALIATTAKPFCIACVAKRENTSFICITYGQWLQINATKIGLEAKSSKETIFPVVGSNNEKEGAFVPSSIITDGVFAILYFLFYLPSTARISASEIPDCATFILRGIFCGLRFLVYLLEGAIDNSRIKR